MSTKTPLSVADIASIVIVLLISAAIGIYFRFSGGRQKTTKEFLVAGRAMSPFPVVFSLIVTYISAIMMLGMPSEVYEFGIYRMLSYILGTGSTVISAYVFLPVYFQMGDSVSVYEYLQRRFGARTRKVASILFVVQTLFCMAVVLYAPALALSAVSDIKLHVSIISIGGICTLYCCLGGMKAVLWTDVFQALVMYVCVFAILVKGILQAPNIPDAFRLVHARENKFFSFDPSVRYTVWNCVLYGFLFGLFNYGCNQAQVQRMLSVKSLKLSQRAVIVSVPLALAFIMINFLIGIVMYANYHDNDPVPCEIDKRDKIVPYFIMNSFREFPGLAGLCIAGIFSGALSTVSSSVNSLSAVTMEDFVRPYFATRWKMTDGMAALLAKVFAFTYGIIGIGCAFAVQKEGLVYVYTVVYGTICGPILGLFTLGMLTASANERGALRGLLCGIFTTSSLGVISFLKMVRCKLVCDNPSVTTYAMNATTSYFLNYTMTMNATTSSFLNYTMTDTMSTGNITLVTDTTHPMTDAITPSSYVSSQPADSPCERKEWLSVMWLLVIGFSVTTVVGYIGSLLAKWSTSQDEKKQNEVDPLLLSPVVRKWLVKTLPKFPENDAEECIKLNTLAGG